MSDASLAALRQECEEALRLVMVCELTPAKGPNVIGQYVPLHQALNIMVGMLERERQARAQAEKTLAAVKAWTEKPAGEQAGVGGPGPLFTMGILAQFDADKKSVAAILAAPDASGGKE